MSTKDRILSESEEQQIVEAIRNAEKNTSGEIRVHIEKLNEKPTIERAQEVFYWLNMQETEFQNGILIYIAYETRKVAIIGDKGIHSFVGDDFWNAENDLLIHYFKQEKYADGIAVVVEHIGAKLKEFFPYNKDDKNELSDEISNGQDEDKKVLF
ncbi:MAG: TPM domain-containing protein [Flavobacteriaceae bacterium]|nr:TPM domain-containing protein [Flavobacteriaceae bacterium]